jgi:class 3 adenylate cyclase
MGSSDVGTEDGRSAADWLAIVARANAGGDYLQAIDAAAHGLREHPASLELRYQQLLGYARAGAGRRALEELEQLEAERGLAKILDSRLRADFLALRGRVFKDRAMRAERPDDRAGWAARAAAAYEQTFDELGGSFPAVNAATLWRVAGDPARSARLASEAINQSAAEKDAYWRNATVGEALCLLGEDEAATRALADAFAASGGRGEAIAATRRQLDWLSRTVGIGGAALNAIPAPRVAHWLTPTGDPGRAIFSHGLSGRGLIAFGSLLSEFDCAIAEALATAGAEINLTLPCAPDICRTYLVERSGSPAGDAFDRSLKLAANVTAATPEGDAADPMLVRLAVEQARGQALIRAGRFLTRAETLDYDAERGEWGARPAAIDDVSEFIKRWPARREVSRVWSRRDARALVFGDVKGFSGLAESSHPAFFEVVLGGFAEAIDGFGAKVEYAETAGDGLYLVVADVISAAALCDALQKSLIPGRLVEAGLPKLQLRLSAHYGPVFPGRDPVTRRDKFFGKEVVRTARIEPVTPPGETYVTEQFAAEAAAGAPGSYSCEYVGRQPMAKGFGECRMYALRFSDA